MKIAADSQSPVTTLYYSSLNLLCYIPVYLTVEFLIFLILSGAGVHVRTKRYSLHVSVTASVHVKLVPDDHLMRSEVFQLCRHAAIISCSFGKSRTDVRVVHVRDRETQPNHDPAIHYNKIMLITMTKTNKTL